MSNKNIHWPRLTRNCCKLKLMRFFNLTIIIIFPRIALYFIYFYFNLFLGVNNNFQIGVQLIWNVKKSLMNSWGSLSYFPEEHSKSGIFCTMYYEFQIFVSNKIKLQWKEKWYKGAINENIMFFFVKSHQAD